jgi:ATP-dependent RNA helicase DeaD
VKLAHEASGAAADEEEIPEVRPREDRPRRDGAPAGPRRERRGPSEGMTRLFLGAGRSSGIRPQDIVGAITGETNLKGRDIGAIEIADRFSLVEVPGQAANDVIDQLRDATIKGKRITIRRERQPR